jgi:hypothetical protein
MDYYNWSAAIRIIRLSGQMLTQAWATIFGALRIGRYETRVKDEWTNRQKGPTVRMHTAAIDYTSENIIMRYQENVYNTHRSRHNCSSSALIVSPITSFRHPQDPLHPDIEYPPATKI